MKDNKFDIEELVIRYCEGNVSESEKCDVENWMSESEENSEIVRKMYTLILATDTSIVCDKIDVDAAWMRMKESIDTCAAESKKNKKKRGWMLWMQRVAAVLFLPLLIGTYLLYVNQQKRDTSVAQVLEIRATSGMTAKTYLPDSTLVYLNAGSVLRYPSEFTGNKREVELMGEAYFEVIADTKRPFYVQVGEVKIQVLGTAFNVSAYREDQQVEVALLRGKVGLDLPGNEYVLAPGEIATWNKGDGLATLRKGDVESIVDWKTGRFNFEDMPLDKLTVKLARWYGVQFIFEDETTKEFRFSGAVTKYRTLDYVLGMIVKTTKVAFQEKDGKILVRKIE